MKRRDFMRAGVAAVALAAVPMGAMAAETIDWRDQLRSKANELETRRANAAVNHMENLIATNPGEKFNDFNVVDLVDEQAWAVIARAKSGKHYSVGFKRIAA